MVLYRVPLDWFRKAATIVHQYQREGHPVQQHVRHPTIPPKHVLTHEDYGEGHRRIHIIEMRHHEGQPALIQVGRLWMQYSPKDNAYYVAEAAAKHGVGPLAYDAAMEAIYPHSLTPDITSRSSPAAKQLWEGYNHRPDVERTPEGYRKKPGDLHRQMMTPAQLNEHPDVQRHLGRKGTVEVVSRDTMDDTPDVPGGWRD